jgi:hypothetical protein
MEQSIVGCCNSSIKHTKCKRQDNKVFSLPRKFTKKRCINGQVNGFTMRSSCAPYKYCKTRKHIGGKKEFLYNPKNPKKSFDVYIDKNPKDTIPIKYTTINDVKKTIKQLEHLYKTDKYPHKRIWQVGMIMKVRLEAINKYKKTKYKNAKNVYKRYILSKRYFEFLSERSKEKTLEERKKMTFIY